MDQKCASTSSQADKENQQLQENQAAIVKSIQELSENQSRQVRQLQELSENVMKKMDSLQEDLTQVKKNVLSTALIADITCARYRLYSLSLCSP